MYDRIRLFQKYFIIGSTISLVLQNGREYIGVLLELSHSDLVLQKEGGGPIVIKLEEISSCETVDVKEQVSEQKLIPFSTKLTVLPEQPILSEDQVETEIPETLAGSPVVKQWIQERENIPNIEDISLRQSVEEQADDLRQAHLNEIIRNFEQRIQTTIPRFETPEMDNLPQDLKSDVVSFWKRIREQYEFGIQYNDLAPGSPRITKLLADIRELEKSSPTILVFKRFRAYFHYLAGEARRHSASTKKSIAFHPNPKISSILQSSLWNTKILQLLG